MKCRDGTEGLFTIRINQQNNDFSNSSSNSNSTTTDNSRGLALFEIIKKIKIVKIKKYNYSGTIYFIRKRHTSIYTY